MNYVNYTKLELEALKKCLEEDIEVLLEEFEDATVNIVEAVLVKRLVFDPPLHGEYHEYQVTIKLED